MCLPLTSGAALIAARTGAAGRGDKAYVDSLFTFSEAL